MKVLIVVMFFTLLAVSVIAQSKFATSKVRVEPYFANQGEQEDYWAKQLFKNEYAPQTFERFKGSISIIGNDSIRYDNTILEVRIQQKTLRTIFEKGIMYVDIIKNFGYRHIGEKVTSVKLDTTKRARFTDEQVEKLQTYAVNNLEEVPFLSNSPHIRRFRFWLFNKLMANPEVCFMELTDDAATTSTSLPDFINGSKLTYFTHAWVVI